jgi:hypothetical protein
VPVGWPIPPRDWHGRVARSSGWVTAREPGGVVDRLCVICGRPLPRRRWWHLLEPPPMCRGNDMPECHRILSQRVGLPIPHEGDS